MSKCELMDVSFGATLGVLLFKGSFCWFCRITYVVCTCYIYGEVVVYRLSFTNLMLDNDSAKILLVFTYVCANCLEGVKEKFQKRID